MDVSMNAAITNEVDQCSTVGSAADLRRRRHAVRALAAFGVLFFFGWISVNVIQALVQGHGLGIGDGYVQPDQVGDPSGRGWAGDTLLLTMTIVIDALIVGVWAWLAPRLRIEGGPDPSPEEVEDESWYLIPVPTLTRVLIVVGIACAVGVSLCGAVLFPLILIRYGW